MTEPDPTDDYCKHSEEDRVLDRSDGFVNFYWCKKCGIHFMGEVNPRPRKRDGSFGKDEETL